MNPSQTIFNLYDSQGIPEAFKEVVDSHLALGFLHSTPTHFIAGRPVAKAHIQECFDDPWKTYSDCDTWLIYAAAGDLRDFISYCPFELEYIAWQRYSEDQGETDQISIHRFKRVAKLIDPLCSIISQSSFARGRGHSCPTLV